MTHAPASGEGARPDHLDVVEAIIYAGNTSPDAPAVVAADSRWSYGDLLRAAAAVRAQIQCDPSGDKPVAFVASKTCASIAVMLGTLQAGGRFAPIEPADPNPAARAARFNASTMIADPRRYLDGCKAVDPAAPTTTTGGYRLLTSGTTDRSKVVEIGRNNLSTYVAAMVRRLQLDESTSWAAVSSLAADLSYTAVFSALATGACLHLVAEDVRRDPRAFREYLEREGVSAVKMTPAHCRAVLGHGERLAHPLRLMVLGGEPLAPELAADMLDSGTASLIVNHYGPAETTVGVACHIVADSSALVGLRTVPIGRPLGNAELVVVNSDLSPVGQGETGELLIGGPTVGSGYFGDPTLTAKRFLLIDLNGEGRRRFFRSGDKCRKHDDGSIEFVSRGGDDVKVRGWRVDPVAVERAIAEVPGIRDARVIVQGNSSQAALDAVVVTDRTDAAVRADLAARVPPHMVPRRIAVLRAIPLLPSGKFDVRSAADLVQPDNFHGATSERDETADPLAAEIADLMSQMLDGIRPDPLDDFLELGGDSVGAIHLLARLQERGHILTAEALLLDLTPIGVAAAIRDLSDGQELVSTRLRPRTGGPLSPAQRWFFGRQYPEPNRWCQAVVLDVAEVVDTAALEAAVGWVIQRHPLLRTRFERSDDTWRAAIVARPSAAMVDVELEGDDDDLRSATELALAHVDISAGRVFVVTLVRARSARTHLLLIAHHLVVDGISWRIILDDLASAYATAIDGRLVDPEPEPGGFWAFAERVGGSSRPQSLVAKDTSEADAETVAFVLDAATTSGVERWSSQAGHRLHEVLLAAFVTEAAGADGTLPVDVEYHGRDLGDTDVARAVGWFTSTATIPAPVVRGGGFEAVVADVAALLSRGADSTHEYAESAAVCFNYLGRFVAPVGGATGWSFSEVAPGPLRGRNQRTHEITLTARIVQGRLAVDLVHSRSVARGDAAALLARLAARFGDLARKVGNRFKGEPEIHRFPWSAAGVLALMPTQARQPDTAAAAPDWTPTVLLTGATGFLGVYLLRDLLEGTSAKVVCLVRPGSALTGRARLADRLSWYFGKDYAAWGERLTVVDGDITRIGLGLDPDTYADLARRVTVIVHAAADVRLFSTASGAGATNVAGTRRILELAETSRTKAVHLMSTTSVAGQWHGDAIRAFVETDRDYGQSFRSAYEESKLRAEELLASFVARGGTGWAHRIGSLTRPVGPGRPQLDLSRNRIAQTILTYVACGAAPMLPNEQMLLTPVDLVSHAIVSLAATRSSEGGTTHLISDGCANHDDVIEALRRRGGALEVVQIEEFQRRADAAPGLDFVRWWLGRGPRRVVVRSPWTTELLSHLGLTLDVADRGAWLDEVVADVLRLANHGVPYLPHP